MSSQGSFSVDEIAILELLVLRHLYDGDVVDYPLPEDHPDRSLFDGLERKGWIARWNRMWPLRDRYRLTDRGIAEIERQYDPTTAEAVLGELRTLGLRPEERRKWLRGRGYDPGIWPVLHDPHTHWETWRYDPGPNFLYLHERLREMLDHERPDPEPAPRWEHVEDLDGLARQVGGVRGDEPYGDIS